METASRAKSKSLNLRRGVSGDAAALGRICFEAFRAISEKHNFPPDFPTPEPAIGLISVLLSRGDVYSSVAEVDGRPVASNFLWEGNEVSGVGPITVDPMLQNGAVGRRLMQDVIERSDTKGFKAVRLVQAAYHNRSLALYTKLGFDTVEPLSLIQGPAIKAKINGYDVRAVANDDIDAVNDLCVRVHGHTREQDVRDGIAQGSAFLVEREGRVTGYTTLIGFFGHTVGETNKDVKALIAAAEGFAGPGFLLPTRNNDLMLWCLENGLKIVQPMTLMSRGFYQEPRGAFLPSILF